MSQNTQFQVKYKISSKVFKIHQLKGGHHWLKLNKFLANAITY